MNLETLKSKIKGLINQRQVLATNTLDIAKQIQKNRTDRSKMSLEVKALRTDLRTVASQVRDVKKAETAKKRTAAKVASDKVKAKAKADADKKASSSKS